VCCRASKSAYLCGFAPISNDEQLARQNIHFSCTFLPLRLISVSKPLIYAGLFLIEESRHVAGISFDTILTPLRSLGRRNHVKNELLTPLKPERGKSGRKDCHS
jgi:hypothetical protein